MISIASFLFLTLITPELASTLGINEGLGIYAGINL